MNESMKFDDNKIKLELIPLETINEIGKVLTFGAKKYKENSWQNLDKFEDRYFGACLRHLIAHRTGEKIDNESNLPHLSHTITNLIFLLWKELQNDTELAKKKI